jgi:hypothetical protein
MTPLWASTGPSSADCHAETLWVFVSVSTSGRPLQNSGQHKEKPMEAQVNHQQIVRWLVCYEFPFDFTRALEFALFRTFCVPSTSRLLNGTGEFTQRA